MPNAIFDNITADYEEGSHCDKGRLQAIIVRHPVSGCSGKIEIFAKNEISEIKVNHTKTCECSFKTNGRAHKTRSRLLEQAQGATRIRVYKGWLEDENPANQEAEHIYVNAAVNLAAILIGMNVSTKGTIPEIMVRADVFMMRVKGKETWSCVWTIDGVTTELHRLG
ncbi:hypothetical protein BKA67DRAFT_655417 [Truncatella angustata]|uniref:Uncharacterized protein n=1 Tax=Truncatella angustata TaxID=152316 RepID=A0A9P8US55_9PEZI|nr:uncharacterized protein BKA67DRAFT_655417 [Truncatella angustata]KAH6657127.1 hypothetical protein BKA67DRAFT_655417 [Truncatella angustata]KAH8200404.1 hypothetical protein TruAng_005433 [Truncatella angustata]